MNFEITNNVIWMEILCFIIIFLWYNFLFNLWLCVLSCCLSLTTLFITHYCSMYWTNTLCPSFQDWKFWISIPQTAVQYVVYLIIWKAMFIINLIYNRHVNFTVFRYFTVFTTRYFLHTLYSFETCEKFTRI